MILAGVVVVAFAGIARMPHGSREAREDLSERH